MWPIGPHSGVSDVSRAVSPNQPFRMTLAWSFQIPLTTRICVG